VAMRDTRAPTLADLQDALGALVEVVVAPDGLDVPVGEPLIYDPSGGPGATAHDVVLMVGVDASSSTGSDDWVPPPRWSSWTVPRPIALSRPLASATWPCSPCLPAPAGASCSA